jgi:hypothetical protein
MFNFYSKFSQNVHPKLLNIIAKCTTIQFFKISQLDFKNKKYFLFSINKSFLNKLIKINFIDKLKKQLIL